MLDKINSLIPAIVNAINHARMNPQPHKKNGVVVAPQAKSSHDDDYATTIQSALTQAWAKLTETEKRFAGAAILAIAKNQGKPIFAGPLWQYLGIDKLPSVKGLTETEVAEVRQSSEYRRAIEARNAVMGKLRGVLYTTRGGLLHLGASTGVVLDVDALLAELVGSTPASAKPARRK